MKKKNLVFFIFLVTLLIAIILSPERFIKAGLQGVSAWTFNVLPAVLPFMILSQLLLGTSYVEKICNPLSKPFVKMYNTSSYSFYVFIVSILSGYPVGSKMIADLYEQRKISKADAFRMSSFCSNSGPMFIVGAVGIGMLGNSIAGYIILLSHILGAIFNGLLYRKLQPKDGKRESVALTDTKALSFGDIIENSCRSILMVGTIIMFFFIIIEFIGLFISPLPENVKSFVYGIIEITKGCQTISSCMKIKMATVLSTIVISFGGLSTALQSISLLKRVEMPLSTFLLQKFTHSIFAGLISFCLATLLL